MLCSMLAEGGPWSQDSAFGVVTVVLVAPEGHPVQLRLLVFLAGLVVFFPFNPRKVSHFERGIRKRAAQLFLPGAAPARLFAGFETNRWFVVVRAFALRW